MKRSLSLIMACSFLLTAGPAIADEPNPKAFQTETNVGMGGPVGLAFLETRNEPTTKPFTFYIAQRFSSPGYSGLTLELNTVLPCGAGANILFDAYHTKNFRLHLFDPGIFYNGNNTTMHRSQASASRLSRRWDMTFGLGASLLVKEGVWTSADWRVFMPDPTLLSKMGELSRQYVDESLKGGQLWVGMSFVW